MTLQQITATCAIPVQSSPMCTCHSRKMTDWTVRDYSLHSSTVYSEVRSSGTKEVLVQFEFTEDVIRKCFSVELFSWMNIFPDVSGESSQSGAQFQGRPSEVWSQWQNQHHSQQAGEQHTHPNPSQTEVFQVRCTHTLKDCCFWTIGLKCVRTCSNCWLLTSRHSYVICLIRAVCPQLTPPPPFVYAGYVTHGWRSHPGNSQL